MKKIFLLSATALLSLFVAAQAWSPVMVNHKMNYKHSDSNYISNTIWVASTGVSNGDSIFNFNRVVTDHPTEENKALRNQPQFLLKHMVRSENGNCSFSNPGEFHIRPLSGLDEEWTFDPSGPVTATITALQAEEVFGITDSVKVISLSDGHEIRLSKSFGILAFPDFENGGWYELAGLQDTEYGESVPGFWEIFNFDIGDVYQTSEYSSLPFGSQYITRKVTINSKDTSNNTYHYNYTGIYRKSYWEAGIGGGVVAYPTSGTLSFPYATSHPADHFPGQIYQLPDSWSGYGTGKVFTRCKLYLNPQTGRVHKDFGAKEESWEPFGADVYYELAFNSDELYLFEYVSLIELPGGAMGIGFAGKLGQTYFSEGYFEYFLQSELHGAVLNDDTIGNILPDSVLLLTEISESGSKKEDIQVYPNPAFEVLHVHYAGYNVQGKIQFEVRDVFGTTILVKNITKPLLSLNISNLPKGVHFYSILKGGRIIQTGKLIFQ